MSHLDGRSRADDCSCHSYCRFLQSPVSMLFYNIARLLCVRSNDKIGTVGTIFRGGSLLGIYSKKRRCAAFSHLFSTFITLKLVALNGMVISTALHMRRLLLNQISLRGTGIAPYPSKRLRWYYPEFCFLFTHCPNLSTS